MRGRRAGAARAALGSRPRARAVRRRRSLVAAAAGLALVSAAGCSSQDEAAAPIDLTVFAAASLTATFQQIGKDFEAEHEGVTVRFTFAGSPDLIQQLTEGAVADVLATADTANMDEAVSEQLIDGTPEMFATNRMEIATPPDNPAKVAGLDDLERADVDLVVCAPKVPCGAAAAQVMTNAEVTVHPVSEESSVTAVLGKVTAGEADAGMVYVTDVINAGDQALGVPIPDDVNVTNDYPAGVVAEAPRSQLAAEFVDHLQAQKAQSVLREAGFGAP